MIIISIEVHAPNDDRLQEIRDKVRSCEYSGKCLITHVPCEPTDPFTGGVVPHIKMFSPEFRDLKRLEKALDRIFPVMPVKTELPRLR